MQAKILAAPANVMSAELIVKSSNAPDQTIPLGPLFSIGRGPGNDLVINDGRASRNHAVIRLQSDKLHYLVDLGSSNGTLLNDRRVSIPIALKTGDNIQIAGYSISFVTQEETAAFPSGAEDMRTQLEFTSDIVSILVVDIRNYTRLSESLPAEFLSKIVGKWFQEVGVIIESNGGEIDKFIGDAVMAYWVKAKTEGNNNYILGPLKAALAMLKTADTFHQQVSSQYPEFGFRVGCGINSGKAIRGNVGVQGRRDFTAVGDCVNIAFRLESLCKELDRCLLVSEEVKTALESSFQFEDLGLQKLKGKSQDQRVFAVKS